MIVYGITYDHTTNYGSCLQAYALQTVIEKLYVGEQERCIYQVIPVRTFKDFPIKNKLKNELMKPAM